MLPHFLRSPMPFLAIDVNSESLQLLEVRATKKYYQLQNYLTHPLPPHCVIQQRVADTTAFSQALVEAITQFKPLAKQAILALPVNQVITKTLAILSHLSPTEVTKHIQQEILSQMPTTPDIYWDYAYVSPPLDQHPATTREITLVIAQQISIQPYLQAFAACKLPLGIIDIESYALARAWQFCYPTLSAQSNLQVLLMLRSQCITLVLLQYGRVLYARVAPIESSLAYETALLPCIQQLWRTLPLHAEWPAITHIALTGECAQSSYRSLLQTELNLPVYLIELGDHLQIPPHFSSIATGALFLSLGLCLWGRDND